MNFLLRRCHIGAGKGCCRHRERCLVGSGATRTVSEGNDQPDVIGAIHVLIEDADGLVQREGGSGELPFQRLGSDLGRVGDSLWRNKHTK